MMRRLIATVTLLLMTLAATPASSGILALCYHNVEDHAPDQTFVGVSSGNLVQHLSWLQRNGYAFVSLDDILAARAGRKALPEKAVLLTFDDGFASFYTRVFPILKAFGAPAVLAVTGSWLEDAPSATVAYGSDAGGKSTVAYGDLPLARDIFLTWSQIRELAGSGLVEIASHSRGLHQGIRANPQGNLEPAVVTRAVDAASAAYESEAAYRQRLTADTAAMARQIERETGRAPRAMVWPYGEHSGLALSIAADHGMPITFTLIDTLGTPDSLGALPRHLITPDPPIGALVTELRQLGAPPPVRVVQVDLDYVYDADPAQQERNLDRLVQRIQEMEISTVFLQAFADPDGSGLTREVYFPNGQLPMRADLFNRVSWQLRTRAIVKVFAWMPVLAFDFGDAVTPVLAWDPKTGAARVDPATYRRVSPFDAGGRQKILALYEDLARAAPFEGLLFHDDALLSDFEDASPAALAAYARAGLPGSIAAIRADPAALQRWTRLKTDTLIAFTEELTERARRYRSPLATARNIFAGPVMEPASEAWFAQSFDRFLETYDYTAIMAMPLMENVAPRDAEAWLQRMVGLVAARPLGLKRTIFELQAVDWRRTPSAADRKIPTATLSRQMRLLARLGALNFGYYPDDFIADHPETGPLHRNFSLQSYPYRP